MTSLGDIIKQANLLTEPAAPAPKTQARLYKVHLCVNIYAEIEVMAETPELAFRIAERQARDARRTGTTAPCAFRAAILQPIDWRAPGKGFKWVRLLQTINNDSGVSTWTAGEEDVPVVS